MASTVQFSLISTLDNFNNKTHVCKFQGLLKVIEENTNKTEDCYYLFELRHAAMCYQNPDSGLSAGSVICIVYVNLYFSALANSTEINPSFKNLICIKYFLS